MDTHARSYGSDFILCISEMISLVLIPQSSKNWPVRILMTLELYYYNSLGFKIQVLQSHFHQPNHKLNVLT